MKTILGADARKLSDYVTNNFQVREATHHRGWWVEDVVGEAARYNYMLVHVAEPARSILGYPLDVISGARWRENNVNGRESSMHLPPVQRALEFYKFLKEPAERRGAAIDVIPRKVDCATAFRILDRAQRDGRLPPAGLFWYAATADNPGPATGRFIHIDFRPNGLAREADKIPPSNVGGSGL